MRFFCAFFLLCVLFGFVFGTSCRSLLFVFGWIVCVNEKLSKTNVECRIFEKSAVVISYNKSSSELMFLRICQERVRVQEEAGM